MQHMRQYEKDRFMCIKRKVTGIGGGLALFDTILDYSFDL